MLTKYLSMVHNKEYDTIRNEVSSMPPCQTQWLNPNFKIEYAAMDSDSSCSDDEDEEMDVSVDNIDVEGTSRRNAPITDEDGWTTVTSKRR